MRVLDIYSLWLEVCWIALGGYDFMFLSGIRLFISLTVCDILAKVSDLATNTGVFEYHASNVYF